MSSTGLTYPPGASVGRTTIYDPDLVLTHPTGVWANAPCWEYMCNPAHGILIDEWWKSYNDAATTGDYVLTQATTGTGANAADADLGTVLLLDCNSTTAAQGVQIQNVKKAITPKAGRKIFAEFFWKVVDTFDKVQAFVGLAPVDTTIFATSANSLDNQIAHYTVQASAGAILFASEKATVGTPKASFTLAEDTFVATGFVVDGVTSCQQYVNGVAVGAAFATANIPVVPLFPSFACLSHGTNDPIMHIRGYRIFANY